MATVKVIDPHAIQPERLRVAAYCRVSSDFKDQLHSYAAQIRSYTEEIAQHDGWELVDVYADEGLTGTRMDRREDFNRMMRDCRKGKIDRILVKSVSRFARNTKDCLSALRELSGMGVTVRFEKENIDTKTLTTELMLLELKKRMDAVSQEQADLLDMLLSNMADAELNARMKVLTGEKESLKAQILEAQQAEVSMAEQAAKHQQMWDSLMECSAGYTEFDDEFVRQIIQKITVENADTIRIHFRDSDVVLEQDVE